VRLRYYTTSSGRQPVAEYVEALAWPERAVLAVLFEEIVSRGLEARGATFRQIEGKLWEIRAGAHRIFYVLSTRNEMVLLHAYRKQSQRTPARHVEMARRRSKEFSE
jgi:phage-related protein